MSLSKKIFVCLFFFGFLSVSHVHAEITFNNPKNITTYTNRIAISDTGNNRILIVTPSGSIENIIGGKEPGYEDGGFDEALFNQPHGTAFADNILYVADTENNRIRAIDFDLQRVTTFAGTGNADVIVNPSGRIQETAFHKPMDILIRDKTMYVSVAGNHQLWQINLSTKTVKPYAGTVQKNAIDAILRRSGFSFPSSMTIAPEKIYFLDQSGTSCRSAELKQTGWVRTLPVPISLVNAADITFYNAQLYITNTGQNQIIVVDPKNGRVQDVIGTQTPGSENGLFTNAEFDHPTGIDQLNNRLYVSDSGNNRLRIIDLKAKNVATLFLNQNRTEEDDFKFSMENFIGEQLSFPQTVSPKLEHVNFTIQLPPNYKLLYNAKPYLRLLTMEGELIESFNIFDSTNQFPIHKHFNANQFLVEVSLFYCREGEEGLCLFKNILYTVSTDPTLPVKNLDIKFNVPDEDY